MSDPATEAAKRLYMADGNGDVDDEDMDWINEKAKSDPTIGRVLAVYARVIREAFAEALASARLDGVRLAIEIVERHPLGPNIGKLEG